MATKNHLFYGEATKGNILKVIIDTLCAGNISRGIFVIEKSGIYLRQSDEGSTILYDIELPCSHLRNYKCGKPMAISVNLKHMQSLLKTIKKKDSVTMHINANSPGKLYITIRPEVAREVVRFEARGMAYQVEENYKLIPLPDGGYKYPMVINASDFQKIKQLAVISKQICIHIQKSNYMSFTCDATIMDAELGFGKLQTEDDIESDGTCRLCGNEKQDCWCECKTCNEYLCDCWCECEDCNQYKAECTCEMADLDVFHGVYLSSILNKLVKLPGLCAQMQFYAPYVEHYPLRIEVNTAQGGYTLGKIQVYIKDVGQITYEASLQNENDTVVQITKPKGKGKKS